MLEPMSDRESRVVLFDEYGPPEVLRLATAPVPEPGPGEVRIRVVAAGVQPFDIKRRRGDTAKWGAPVTFPATTGNEVAGVVDALGPEVTGLRVGDTVAASAPGNGCADFAVVPAASPVVLPDGLDPVLAAAFVAAGQTASGALELLGVTAGDTLLVHAAAGGVGSVAVQLGRLAGATVIGTASPANHDYLRSLGALPVAHGPGLVDRVRTLAPDGVTVALDAIGGEAIPASIAAGAPPERVGSIADKATAEAHGARAVIPPRSPERFARVLGLVAAGKLVMPVRTYPLTEIQAAHREVEAGHVRGRVLVLT
jgi:NADPH:quinone reductase-like Zn-dependent oxidoreductase